MKAAVAQPAFLRCSASVRNSVPTTKWVVVDPMVKGGQAEEKARVRRQRRRRLGEGPPEDDAAGRQPVDVRGLEAAAVAADAVGAQGVDRDDEQVRLAAGSRGLRRGRGGGPGRRQKECQGQPQDGERSSAQRSGGHAAPPSAGDLHFSMIASISRRSSRVRELPRTSRYFWQAARALVLSPFSR